MLRKSFEKFLFCAMIVVMKVEIVRMRRKTMVLKVEDSKHAVLKVPTNISDRKISEFLESKKNWLDKVQKRLSSDDNFAQGFDFWRFIYLNGEKFADVHDFCLDFDGQSKEKQLRTIKKCYLSYFSKLEELTGQIALKTGLKFKEIKPVESVRVWGSFNSKGIMKLNWKLLILPERLAVYVICHELCHSLHMNHKPQFWADLGKICPNFKTLKKELSHYGFVLKNWLNMI